MPSTLLVQPDSCGRISGGYLYNTEMARHGAWELWQGPAEALPELFASIEHDVLLVDSLWLTERDLPAFIPLRARGVRVGALIHALPSRIQAAELGHVALSSPSPFERRALAELDFCLVPGPFYAALLGDVVARLFVLEPGVDASFRMPPRPRGDVCELISVGAVTPLKGFLEVLDVFSELERLGPVRWTVVGSLEADRAYAARFSERARAFRNIRILGQRSPLEVRELVQRSDVLVMPSREENHPLVLLEAMTASVPSVAYAVGASARIIEHGVTGAIAPLGDQARFFALLAELLQDEARRSAMAHACFVRATELPSWADAALRARSVLESLRAGTCP